MADNHERENDDSCCGGRRRPCDNAGVSVTPTATTRTRSSREVALRNLDQEYSNLSQQESRLREILVQLREEDLVLQQALTEASETGIQRLQQQRREKEQAVITRLEQALMETSSNSSTGSSPSDHNDEGKYGRKRAKQNIDEFSLFSSVKTSVASIQKREPEL